jgi:hypothetical protein
MVPIITKKTADLSHLWAEKSKKVPVPVTIWNICRKHRFFWDIGAKTLPAVSHA